MFLTMGSEGGDGGHLAGKNFRNELTPDRGPMFDDAVVLAPFDFEENGAL